MNMEKTRFQNMDFTEELRLFRERTEPRHFQGLIIVGTGQSTTAALLLSRLKADHIAFLLTDQTKTMPEQVAEKLDCSSADWLRIPLADTSTLSIYTGVKAVIEQWSQLERAQIALDMTGGQKPMTVGLAKAGHLLGLQTLYIESDYGQLTEGKSGLLPGTQRLVIPPNPYEMFGDIEAEEAKRLYRDHDYNGAQRIFTKLAKKVPEAQRYQLYADLSEAYDAWELLDFKRAAEKLSAVVENKVHDPLIKKFIGSIQEQLVSVTELACITSDVAEKDTETQLNILSQDTKVLYLLSTLRAIAVRRAFHNRYDVAALYMYRIIELISQHRLAKYKVLTKYPEFSGMRAIKEDIEEAYQKTRHKLKSNDGRDTLNDNKSISLFEGYIFLKALEDKLVEKYNIKRIMDKSSIRNNSILAHGYCLISEDEYEKFAKVANELYERLLNLYNEDKTEWDARSQFIQPFA